MRQELIYVYGWEIAKLGGGGQERGQVTLKVKVGLGQALSFLFLLAKVANLRKDVAFARIRYKLYNSYCRGWVGLGQGQPRFGQVSYSQVRLSQSQPRFGQVDQIYKVTLPKMGRPPPNCKIHSLLITDYFLKALTLQIC